MTKQIQIIGGEMRELDVAEKSVVAIPPGTELIFADTLSVIASTAKKSSDEVLGAIIVGKGLADKRRKAQGSVKKT